MSVRLLHNIGPKINENYNTPEQVLACEDFLTFDGVYHNVFRQRHLLRGKDGILFITGDYMGKDNSFDAPMPLESFCTMEEVQIIMDETGFALGWHTWSHRDLTKLSDAELEYEVTPIVPMRYFAYPYGRYDNRVVEAVRRAGYEKAYSVTQGNDNPLTLFRNYL